MDAESKASVFKSGILSIAIRWSNRLIGFISTVILARLLDPDDFGIVALAYLVTALIGVLSNFGVHVALIQNKNPTVAHYNTAWTLRLIQMGVAALVVLLVAPLAADYFDEPRLTPVLRILSLGLVIAGFRNIGIINFQKEMRFDLELRFVTLTKIVSFLVLLIMVWQIGSYWAMVFGTLFQKSFGTLLSYVMHPMRPSFSLEKFKEIFSVSQWLLIKNVGVYLDQNLHKIFVGGISNNAIMGGYTMADQIASLPGSDLLGPINRALFPVFVRVKDDLRELKRLFLLAQGVQTMVVMPTSVGLALVAPEAVYVLLGEKWLFAVPFLQVLALTYLVHSITTSSSYVMITMGYVSRTTLWVWAQAIVFLIIVAPIQSNIDTIQIAELRLLTVFGGLFLAIGMLKKTLNNVSNYEIIITILRPVLATLIMAVTILAFAELTEFQALTLLSLEIGIGLISYFVSIAWMWRVVGQPKGAESYLLEKVLNFYKKTCAPVLLNLKGRF